MNDMQIVPSEDSDVCTFTMTEAFLKAYLEYVQTMNARYPDKNFVVRLRLPLSSKAVSHEPFGLAIVEKRYDQTYAQPQKQEPVTFESIMEQAYKLRYEWHQEMLSLPELRANSQTIGIIGHTLAAYTTQVDYPYTLITPGTLCGMTIDIDETVPDGEIRPVYPKPSL